MKIVVISNTERPQQLFEAARAQGYITFIYSHADPQRQLSSNKFSYVRSDEELQEKINLLHADVTIQEEIIRW